MSKQVLGKGLSALIPKEADTRTDDTHYLELPLNQISPNPLQPRRKFDDDRLGELAQSIRENGIVQPLVVSRDGDRFTIVAGERRFRAARLAGLERVPAVIMDGVDDTRLLELALVENIQREDLNPLEMAEAFKRLIEQCGLTQEQLAQRVGRSRAAVANHLRLLTLPPSIKRLITDGKLTEGHARQLIGLDGEAQMLEMAEKIISGTLSVRDTERAATRRKRRRLTVKRTNPALAEMESDLKRLMGTSVKIIPGLKKGRIEVEYYGDEDLSRLWQLFRKMDA